MINSKSSYLNSFNLVSIFIFLIVIFSPFGSIVDEGTGGGDTPSLVENQARCIMSGRICNIWSGRYY